MGFSFNFFGKFEVRKFNYRPRYYNPEEEERREMFGDHKAKKEEYVPGQLVRGAMRDGAYKESKEVTKNQKFLGMVTLVLMFAVVFALFKYFPKLLQGLKDRQDKAIIEEFMAPSVDNRLNGEIIALKALKLNRLASQNNTGDELTLAKCYVFKANDDDFYVITLSDETEFTVLAQYSGTYSGLIAIKEFDNEAYWMIYKDGLLVRAVDVDGNPISVVSATPKVKVDSETYVTSITFDEGKNWLDVEGRNPGVFAGAEFVSGKNNLPEYLTLTLVDGEEIRLVINDPNAVSYYEIPAEEDPYRKVYE